LPHYRKHGKILSPLSASAFEQLTLSGRFTHFKHKGFLVLLYYSGIRRAEALRVVKEQFQITEEELIFSVGLRLKKRKPFETPPLHFPLDLPFIDKLVYAIENTKPNNRVFPFSEKTAYNICDRVGYYPHYFRLNRITQFFLRNYSIAQVRSYVGLSLRALEFYIGLVDIIEMGKEIS